MRDLLSDTSQIPDNAYVNGGAAIVVALLLNLLAIGVFKLFGLCLGVACGYGLSTGGVHAHRAIFRRA